MGCWVLICGGFLIFFFFLDSRHLGIYIIDIPTCKLLWWLTQTELPAATFQVCLSISPSNLLPPSSCLGVREMGILPLPCIFSNNCDVKCNYLWRNLLYAWMKGTHANPQQEREITAMGKYVPKTCFSGRLCPRPSVQILTSWTQYDFRNAKKKLFNSWKISSSIWGQPSS